MYHNDFLLGSSSTMSFISNSGSKQVDAAPKKMARKQKVEVKVPTPNGNGKDLSEKEALERSRDDRKEVIGQSSKEQRV